MNEGTVLEMERDASALPANGYNSGQADSIDPGKAARVGADFRLGRVISISGSQVIFLVEAEDHENDPDAIPALQIGSLVKMPTPHSLVFGMISGLSVPIPDRDRSQVELKIGEMDLIGESPIGTDGKRTSFRRGVSTFPQLGTSVIAATLEDLSLVYARPAVTTARIGAIHQDRSLPAHIVVDDLLGKHFAILGATGSGKSCAVALILRAILGQHRNAHVILLDPHNEYSRAFGDTAEVIDLRGLQMPYWLFNFQEFCEVLVHAGVSIGMAEAAILGELIPAAKRQFLNSADARHITVDTPSPYRMTLVLQMVDEAMGRLEKPDSLAPYQRLKAGLNAIMSDARFNFMFGGLIAMRDNMATILSRIFRIPVDGKPATILDLSGLPSEILNVVVSVICRVSFDFALWSDGAVPILLVCEEAHRYAPEDSRLGFEPTKRALSRIAKEGRKYGLSLCVVTQRPSELAAGMLSQCNTIFALRLGHQRDQDIVRAAMSESAFGLLDALPSLGNAEAIAVGEGVSIPMRLAFDILPAEHRPKSGTANFSSSWQKDTSNSDEFLGQVIDNWRRQRR